jgi:8-oxo-dGTP pyrophosphatase MutT (NUDIX family)
MIKQTATVIVVNDSGLVLGVSRKTDHNDFGFPGGKLEDYDKDTIAGLKREVREETGLELVDIELINQGEYFEGFYENTFVAKAVGEIQFDNKVETHVVKWLIPEKVMEGSFGKYNEMVLGLIGIKRRTGAALVEAKLKWYFDDNKITLQDGLDKLIDKVIGY